MNKKIVFAVLMVITVAGLVRADTSTNRAGLTKPSIGSASWGPKLNTNFDTIDSNFAVLAATNTFSTYQLITGTLSVSGTPTDTNHVARYKEVYYLWRYRRPTLQWSSVTQVSVEGNTLVWDAAGTRSILFPDMTLRENTSATLYNFDITRNVVLTVAGGQSGLRSGLSEQPNSWYAIYAVKQTDGSQWVVAGDTTTPTSAAEVSALNSYFGTDDWVYLGMIRNGNNADKPSDILEFQQDGNFTMFYSSAAGSWTNTGLIGVGIRLSSAAAATTLTYTYSVGTGTINVPRPWGNVSWWTASGAVAGNSIVTNAAGTAKYFQNHANSGVACRTHISAAIDGVQLSNGPGSSIAYDIFLIGGFDRLLGGTINGRH